MDSRKSGKMKPSRKTAAVFVVRENIEMKRFSSEETLEVVTVSERQEELCFHKDHPLASDSWKDPEPRVHVKQQTAIRTKCSGQDDPQQCSLSVSPSDSVEIEMKILSPIRVQNDDLVEIKSSDSSVLSPTSPNKRNRLKWRRSIPQKSRLVVKDVLCLPRGHDLSQLERNVATQSEVEGPVAVIGLCARITMDSGWSASQTWRRLGMLFQERFIKTDGQRFSFTYLQCVQGSRVMFVPETPAEGWTGEQVLRICGHGHLYILSHHDYLQPETIRSTSETSVVKRNKVCLEERTEMKENESTPQRRRIQAHSSPGQANHSGGLLTSSHPSLQFLRLQPHPGSMLTQQRLWFLSMAEATMEHMTLLNLDSLLAQFRQVNVDLEVKHHIQLKRTNVLQSALEILRNPDFCFRSSLAVCFSGEETKGPEEPLREFFRLVLQDLQKSCVFEGHAGCLFLTHDLTALKDGKYYEAGVLTGWSLTHSGHGPRCLHPALYELMCCQKPPLKEFSWKDIADSETQMRLQELHSCADVKLLSPRLCEWISSCGISEICPTDGISAIYIQVVKHHIYDRVSRMIVQFTEGLNTCGGLWDLIQSHWQEFEPVMTNTQQQQEQLQQQEHSLALEEFRKLFTVCHDHSDSQLKAAEEVTAGHWETALAMISNGLADFSLEDLLAFITNAYPLSPGSHRLISLHFHSQDVDRCEVQLPHASIGALELYLPRGVAGPEDLLAQLNEAVHNTTHCRQEAHSRDRRCDLKLPFRECNDQYRCTYGKSSSLIGTQTCLRRKQRLVLFWLLEIKHDG